MRFIKNLFRKSDTTDEDKNMLIFSIDKAGHINLDFVFANQSDLDAKNLAILLYELNRGIYVDSIIKIMVEISKNNISARSFINEVFSRWYVDIAKENLANLDTLTLNNDPIIKPSEFGISK
jgi:hypothetical protein